MYNRKGYPAFTYCQIGGRVEDGHVTLCHTTMLLPILGLEFSRPVSKWYNCGWVVPFSRYKRRSCPSRPTEEGPFATDATFLECGWDFHFAKNGFGLMPCDCRLGVTLPRFLCCAIVASVRQHWIIFALFRVLRQATNKYG